MRGIALILILSASLVPDRVFAQAIPLTQEFVLGQVMTYDGNSPRGLALGDGTFLAVWRYPLPEKFFSSLRGRIVSSDGIPGPVFDVIPPTFGLWTFGLASAPYPHSGDELFLVTWTAALEETRYVFGELYEVGGTPTALWQPFPIASPYLSVPQLAPVLIREGTTGLLFTDGIDGGHSDLRFITFDAEGNTRSDSFAITDTGAPEDNHGIQYAPGLAANAEGRGLAVWLDGLHPDRPQGIYLRPVHLPSAHPGRPLPLGTEPDTSESFPALAIGAEANHGMVVWRAQPLRGGEGTLLFQLHDLRGHPLTEPRPVRDFTTGQVLQTTVAADRHGNFLVAWGERHSAKTYRLHARAFDAAGIPLGPSFQVGLSSPDATLAFQPHIAFSQEGTLMITWRVQTLEDQFEYRGQLFRWDPPPSPGPFPPSLPLRRLETLN